MKSKQEEMFSDKVDNNTIDYTVATNTVPIANTVSIANISSNKIYLGTVFSGSNSPLIIEPNEVVQINKEHLSRLSILLEKQLITIMEPHS